jgi:hypothetical protein
MERVSMNVIFDNNAFIHLLENPQYKVVHDTFFSRIEDQSIKHIGTIEFFEELFLLHQHNPKKYMQIAKEYWKSVKGRILLPWNMLVRIEVENRCCLSSKDKYWEPQSIIDLENIIFSPEQNTQLSEQITQGKDTFAEQMNTSLNELLDELISDGHEPKEVRKGFKAWYNSIDSFIQNWIESAFSIQYVHYSELPHTKALFEFTMCRHYEVIALNISYKGNDFYDRAYYVASAETGLFVTDDKALYATCSLINSSEIFIKTARDFLL